MAEENVDAILGIGETSAQEPKQHCIFDNTPEDLTQIDPHSASNGLKNASDVCHVLLWIGVILAVVGGLVFFVIDYASEGDSWSAKYQARCAVGSACFIYGIIGALFSYVFSKILIGLSVMTKASETYLSGKK